MSNNINQHACSAGCVFAHDWTGISTNGGCGCLSNVKSLDDRLQIKRAVNAYKDRIRELEDELATQEIEHLIKEN